MKYLLLPPQPPHLRDLRHCKVTLVIYLSDSLTRLLPTSSRPQHHSEVELDSSCEMDRVINLMLPVFVVTMKAVSTFDIADI